MGPICEANRADAAEERREERGEPPEQQPLARKERENAKDTVFQKRMAKEDDVRVRHENKEEHCRLGLNPNTSLKKSTSSSSSKEEEEENDTTGSSHLHDPRSPPILVGLR